VRDRFPQLELEAHGEAWRLSVEVPGIPLDDPRRV
jgi:hypothetical protein